MKANEKQIVSSKNYDVIVIKSLTSLQNKHFYIMTVISIFQHHFLEFTITLEL